jgi:cytochrome c
MGNLPVMKKSLFLAVPAALAGLAALPLAVPVQAQAAADGATLFRQRCGVCHSVTPGQVSPLAPNLVGVVGRKAGSTAFAYSPALKSSNVTWTRANLDRFLTAPGRMVPGTRMVVALPDAAQRTAVLNYLATRR